jgi:hypothetical protein
VPGVVADAKRESELRCLSQPVEHQRPGGDDERQRQLLVRALLAPAIEQRENLHLLPSPVSSARHLAAARRNGGRAVTAGVGPAAAEPPPALAGPTPVTS